MTVASPRVPGGDRVRAEHAVVDGIPCTVIRDVDRMDPFMVNVVSDGDLWLFAGSNGPCTAGRRHQDLAIFPYETVDRLLARPGASGPLTVIRAVRGHREDVWEPWAEPIRRGGVRRSFAKAVTSCAVVYEEVNEDLGLTLRSTLTATDELGLVRESVLENTGTSAVGVRYLDGWNRIIPPGVTSDLFARFSYLAVAYMRHERVPDTDLALFTLNAAISDRPEPSESLRTAAAWSTGHPTPTILLSDRQVEAFRRGRPVTAEAEVRGEAGAYLAVAGVTLAPGGRHTWTTVVDTGLDHAAAIALVDRLRSAGAALDVHSTVLASREAVRRLVAGADGIQVGGDAATTTAFTTAVTYNVMRGGTFDGTYTAPGPDVARYVAERSPAVHERHATWLASLAATVDVREVVQAAALQGDPQLSRILRTYLPLTFSRRHGDPSRPWNRFTIRLRDEQGRPVYAYEGNWRDIFQNWEALARSYPDYLDAFISVFLDASTADGYNPYRITRAGPDWEVLDERDPWSHIGYWGDHQVVYLLRLLESLEHHRPGALAAGLGTPGHAYAHVPYRIRPLADLAADPRSTIDFDHAAHQSILADVARHGADAKQLRDADGEVILVSRLEKLLVPALVKLSNLVPGGGIWLNTQRPEWNDGNNALAGWGLSMVTVAALGRYLGVLERILASSTTPVPVSGAVVELLDSIEAVLRDLPETPDDAERHAALMALGAAGEQHRSRVYASDLGAPVSVDPARIHRFLASALRVVRDTIRAARRTDGLYHGYNVLELRAGQAIVSHLDLMLEGQVAVLDSGLLDETEAVGVMRALRASALWRPDQGSYMLAPDRQLQPYLERNTLAGEPPVHDPRLFTRDHRGSWHFAGELSTAADVRAVLDDIAATPEMRAAVLDLWATMFGHREFTGRSGRFFMFEGLGSIFWHMASKHRLAVLRCLRDATDPEVVAEMAAWYAEARAGLGFTKSPDVFGAFPGDPHSHSPAHRGAQQPGMTGQSKEDILARWDELGVEVRAGRLSFLPRLLRRSELVAGASVLDYVDATGLPRSLPLAPGSLAFTMCGVPVSYSAGDAAVATVATADGTVARVEGAMLDAATSASIFGRAGQVVSIAVTVPAASLRP